MFLFLFQFDQNYALASLDMTNAILEVVVKLAKKKFAAKNHAACFKVEIARLSLFSIVEVNYVFFYYAWSLCIF